MKTQETSRVQCFLKWEPGLSSSPVFAVAVWPPQDTSLAYCLALFYLQNALMTPICFAKHFSLLIKIRIGNLNIAITIHTYKEIPCSDCALVED